MTELISQKKIFRNNFIFTLLVGDQVFITVFTGAIEESGTSQDFLIERPHYLAFKSRTRIYIYVL
jgi:hypothetical protein